MTRKGWLLFAAMSVIWGVPYLFIKIAVRELDPGFVVFARVAIAALVLLPLAFQRGVVQKLRGRWLVIVGLALVQIVIPFLLISYGEQHISSSLTSLLIASEPLLIALFALRFDASERVKGLRLLGLLIGLGGVAVLLGLDVSGDGNKLLGAVFMLLATASYAVGALFLKRPRVAALPRLGIVAGECAVATVGLLPLAVIRHPVKIPGLDVLLSLVVLGLICTALAYLAFFTLVAEVGASRGIVFTYVNPAVSVLLGRVFLVEPINIATVTGFLLILLGSWLSVSGRLSPLLRSTLRTSLRSSEDRDSKVAR